MTDRTRTFGTDPETLCKRAREDGFVLGLRLAIEEARYRGHHEYAEDLMQIALSNELIRGMAAKSFPELKALFAAGAANAARELNGGQTVLQVVGAE
jgi:hypothetical protein